MAVRVVVTGSSGMLGGGLVRHLAAEGREVTGVDLRPGPDQVPGVRYATGDIRDTPLMTELAAGAGAVVHCAAALPSYPDEEIRDVIVRGTGSVLTAASRAGVPRVVHISSTAVYGLPSVVPTPETHPRRPVDAYSRAKAAAEEVAERFRAEGMCVPILRPKTFLGPGRMGLFAMLFEWAQEGRDFPVLGRGEARIQMLAVDDLFRAISRALDAPPEVAGDTFNIAAADFATLREDFQAVLDAAGRGGRVRSIPARPALAVLRLLGRAGASPVYDRLLYKLLADSYVSVDRARDRLGFEPLLSNRDAILRTYEWWRRHAGPAAGSGRTSRDAWRQGALSLAKVFF
ncbi:NAD-dependent epimerase/dehydratase family protein [Microbispora sp. RL4-1S]|uniref:NAD-dependent epimerase/dehydratase family protein n=1 Tax=Microbispora oryzae TaxID=2806554 RepID=A0A940WMI9_9ACTN|nr:NAD-dependent epimerase/dehydratase family protein [Microbispora oryzae]MBP2708424.1 NAD-dependent epimerase/dehydratase family protein [Microbispora oryzae]